MSSVKLACSYYLLGISIFAIAFFGFLIALEWTESEYLRIHFHSNQDQKSMVFKIMVGVGVYAGVAIFLWQYINKVEKEELHKSFKRVERPSIIDLIERP